MNNNTIQKVVDMRGFIGIVMSVLVCSLGGCSLGWADVFKAIEEGDGVDLKKAVSSDVHGHYYREAQDYPINSQLSGGNHDVDGGEDGGYFSKGYGTVNLNAYIYEDLINKGFSSVRANQMSLKVNLKELKKLEYSDPVEADLLKHFHVAAILKEGIRVQQYAELQKAVDDSIYKLAARSQLLCINDKLKKSEGRGGLDEAFDGCLDKMPFIEVSAQDGLLLKSLKMDAYSKKNADLVVSIAGDVRLTGNNYVFIGPKKHIGNVLADNRKEYMTQINDLLNQYLGRNQDGGERYVVDEDKLKELNLPGFTVQEYQIRNLALLEEKKSLIAVAQLASRLAYIKTVQRYNLADECLRRALENPKVDAVYKSFIQDRRQFLKEELNSLSIQKELTQDYAKEMGLIISQADQERSKTIKQLEMGSRGDL